MLLELPHFEVSFNVEGVKMLAAFLLCIRSIHSVKGELVPHLVRRHGIRTSTSSTQMAGKSCDTSVCVPKDNGMIKSGRKWKKLEGNNSLSQITQLLLCTWSIT